MVSSSPISRSRHSRRNTGTLHDLLDRALIVNVSHAGWTRYLKAGGTIAVITFAGALLDLRVAPTNLAMLYLLGVVFISYRWGFGPALTSSLISTLTYDFFFIRPYESFVIRDIWYFITASTLICVGVGVSIMTTTVRRHVLIASQREAQTATLYELTKSLASAGSLPEVLQAAAIHIRTTFGFEVAILLESEAGGLVAYLEAVGVTVDEPIRAAAERVVATAKNSSSGREGGFLLLRAAEHVFGVIVLMPVQPPPTIGSADAVVLEASAGQIALAIKRVRLEERARNAEREQQRAQQAKADAIATLASGLAHDLNNILTGVLGNASLAANKLPLNHPSRKLLGDLVTSGERAANIVAQVLAYAGKGRFFDEFVDISTLVQDFLKSMPPRPPNIELRIKLAEDLPRLKGDRNQLLQLIGNLYLNATEAIGETRGTIMLSTFRQRCAREGERARSDQVSIDEYVCLSVEDTGCGIDESIRSRIFDPFFTTKFIGRGLGLSAAQGIMRAHNGVIRVCTEPGKGSTFTCAFRVQETSS